MKTNTYPTSNAEAQMTHALWDAADEMAWDELDAWDTSEPAIQEEEEAEEELADAMENENEKEQNDE